MATSNNAEAKIPLIVHTEITRAKMPATHCIIVLSGKGGVGNSTISANLAVSLSQKGYAVGLF